MRPILPLCVLLLAAVGGFAADQPLAVFQVGPATIDGAAAAPGATIASGGTVKSAEGLVRIGIDGAPGSAVILSPKSALTLTSENGKIVLALDAGTVQVDLPDRGRWPGLVVRGAASEARVVGTLFIVERTRTDADYIVLVRGALKVGLRREVALALNRQTAEVDLLPRQGVSASTGGGLGSAETLSSRPQVLSIVSTQTAHDQGLIPDPAGSSWATDIAATETMRLMPEFFSNLAREQANVAINQQVAQTAAQQVASDLSRDISREVSNVIVDEIRQQVTQQVVLTVIGTSPNRTALAGPPGPPP